jgi:GNAT superfamily N-acetyltransferase
MSEMEFRALTPDCWQDFEQLFGPKGVCGGCWCMYWKLGRKEFDGNQGENNRLAQKAIVDTGIKPGLLAYVNGTPAGWVAVEPRTHYPTLARSRILKPVDDLPVWSITCFFVDRKYRRQGLSVALLMAAVEHVRHEGGTLLEGYPVDPGENKKYPPVFAYTGLVTAYLQAGFKEVRRKSTARPIMRRLIE